MKLRILSIVGPLIKVSITDVKSLILHYAFCLFSWRSSLNRPKWRVGPNISSVNILILTQGCPMNNIIPLQETP